MKLPMRGWREKNETQSRIARIKYDRKVLFCIIVFVRVMHSSLFVARQAVSTFTHSSNIIECNCFTQRWGNLFLSHDGNETGITSDWQTGKGKEKLGLNEIQEMLDLNSTNTGNWNEKNTHASWFEVYLPVRLIMRQDVHLFLLYEQFLLPRGVHVIQPPTSFSNVFSQQTETERSRQMMSDWIHGWQEIVN